MKLSTSVFFILLLPLSPAHAQTAVSGDIHDYRFDLTGSPFFVEKDIVVPSGTKCTIDAGCIFLYRPFTGLLVEGTLIVNGTPEQPVVFTSVNDTAFSRNSGQPANSFDWNGITVAAESNGSSFSNTHVSYSVYGIKSQTPNLVIKQCLFSQNGQFHFTIKEKIQDVRENIFYSFPAVSAVEEPLVDQPVIYATLPPDSAPAPAPVLAAPVKLQPSGEEKKRIIRYGCLGIGISGIIGGTVLAVMANKDAEQIERMDPHTINPATGSYYQRTDKEVTDEKDSFTLKRAGSIAGFVVGGLGLAGFAVTFLF